jgi:hypothetical protein
MYRLVTKRHSYVKQCTVEPYLVRLCMFGNEKAQKGTIESSFANKQGFGSGLVPGLVIVCFANLRTVSKLWYEPDTNQTPRIPLCLRYCKARPVRDGMS